MDTYSDEDDSYGSVDDSAEDSKDEELFIELASDGEDKKKKKAGGDDGWETESEEEVGDDVPSDHGSSRHSVVDLDGSNSTAREL